MKNKVLIICSIVICFFSCHGNKSESGSNVNDSISCNILGVFLSDNPYVIKEKLTKGGYHWDEKLSSNGICTIELKEEFSFSGYYFEDLTFSCLDARIFMIDFEKECDSLKEAQLLYDDISKKISSKYSKYKMDRLNDDYISYAMYDDGKTNLSIGLGHHEQEEILPFFNEELKHMAREYWKVFICYQPSDLDENKKKNDF